MKKPKVAEPPAWVREHVAAKRYAAPGREKIRRDAPGMIPDGQVRWTEEGSQAGARRGNGGNGGAVGARGMMAGLPAAVAAVDDSVAAPGLGVQPHYAVEEFGVRENMSAGVNLANGNLVVRDTDVKINAPGLATQSDRFYNGLSVRNGMFGQKWSMAGGQDVGLEIAATTVTLRGPSGFRAAFTGSGSSWTAPKWFKGTLAKQTGGSWTVNAKGSGMKLRFDGGGYLVGHQDRNGLGLHYRYNSDYTTASVTDAAGRVVTYAYQDGRVSSMRDSAGRVYSYTYTSAGMLASSTNPDGATTGYGYDGSNRLTRITTPRGVSVDFGYDSAGRVTSVSRYTELHAGGEKQTTTFAYPSSTTTTQTNPNGKTWTYTRDSLGLVSQVKDPLGRVRSQQWNPANYTVQKATDAMGAGGVGGNISSYSYDAQNNPTQVKMPTGSLSSAVYTTGGSCTGSGGTADQAKCITDDANNQTTMNYDAFGNLLSSADTTSGGSGAKVSYSYQRGYSETTGPDCGGKPGQRCSATDANGNKTSYAYDSDGNLIKATPPAPLGVRTFRVRLAGAPDRVEERARAATHLRARRAGSAAGHAHPGRDRGAGPHDLQVLRR